MAVNVLGSLMFTSTVGFPFVEQQYTTAATAAIVMVPDLALTA
jgi:hypothetical protein